MIRPAEESLWTLLRRRWLARLARDCSPAPAAWIDPLRLGFLR